MRRSAKVLTFPKPDHEPVWQEGWILGFTTEDGLPVAIFEYQDGGIETHGLDVCRFDGE